MNLFISLLLVGASSSAYIWYFRIWNLTDLIWSFAWYLHLGDLTRDQRPMNEHVLIGEFLRGHRKVVVIILLMLYVLV